MACIADEMNSERTGRPCLGAGRRLNSTTVHESWNITCFGGHPIHTATASYGAWALYIHCSYRLDHLAMLCMARNWEYRIIITTCRYYVSCSAMAQTLLRNPMTTGGSVALRRLAWGLAGSVTVECGNSTLYRLYCRVETLISCSPALVSVFSDPTLFPSSHSSPRLIDIR